MNVLITGASRGIGKAIAEKFSNCDYNVFTPTRAELDLADGKSIEGFVKKHAETFDIIINNAGINDIGLLENITDTEIEAGLQVNLIAPLKLLRGLTAGMKKRRFGRIVNIGSIWAVVSKPGRAVYSAAKNALHGVTNTIAIELAEYSILANTLCPGFTLTELTVKNNSPKDIANIEKNIPLKRMAKPEEIAETVFFLGSKNNTYLTGQKIVVDGGYTIV